MKKSFFYGILFPVLAVQGSLHCMMYPRSRMDLEGRLISHAPGLESIYDDHLQRRIDWLRLAKEKLAAIGNVYAVEPKDASAPLDREHVMNDYWKSVAATLNSDLINEALEKLLAINFGAPGYYLKRYHIAAALYAGANPKLITFHEFIDAQTDYVLCQMLLERGCDPNARWLDTPMLFRLRTVQMAQLFLQHGASIREVSGRESLFFKTIQPDYETGLIELYKRAGLSVKGSHNYKALLVDFALLHAVHYSSGEKLQMLEAKVHALLGDMSPEDIQEMVRCRPYPAHGNVFEILSNREGPGPRLLEKTSYSHI